MERNHKHLEEKIIAEQTYVNELVQSIQNKYALAVDTATQIASCRNQNAPTGELVDEMERQLINARFLVKNLSRQLNKYILDIMDTCR